MHRFSGQTLLVIFLAATAAAAQTNTLPSSGNVGIGTVSPGTPLSVSLNEDNGAIQIQNLLANNYTQMFFSGTGRQYQLGVGNGNETGLGVANKFYIFDAAAVAMRMVVDGSGNVGIGTTSPGAKLEVNGNILLTAGSGASMTYPDGTVQSTAWNGVLSGGDYAESVKVSGDRKKYEPGDVLVIDPASEGNFLKSSAPYSTAVTGIYSTKPGVVGRRQLTARANMKEEVPMAMTGIVPTKVSAENGPIKPGDLLVTSSKSGYAMKGTDRTQMLGAVLGKAMGHLDSGVGVIEAAVTLQ